MFKVGDKVKVKPGRAILWLQYGVIYTVAKHAASGGDPIGVYLKDHEHCGWWSNEPFELVTEEKEMFIARTKNNQSVEVETMEAAEEWARKQLANNVQISEVSIAKIVAIVERQVPPIVVRTVG